jgi:RNA polymerase sigma factor (sigma-70 family)
MEPYQRQEHAEACAGDAAVVIRTQPFPFDTEFNGWACTVVIYVCANHVRRERGGPSVPDRAQVSLDEDNGLSQVIRDPSSENDQRRADQRHDLMQHVSALSDAQQQFVMLHYFEEMGYDQIVDIMDRSKNALYKLNFDALANLRKKLLLSEHNYE